MSEEILHQENRDETASKPPVNLRQTDQLEEYSGFIIVRLATDFAAVDSDNLMEVAREKQLDGLRSILNQFDLSSTTRVVRSLPPAMILALEQEAAKTDLPPLYSLTTYWRIDVRHSEDQVEEIVTQLNGLDEVDLAYREYAVSDPAVDADDTYADRQDYLDAAPVGIDARWAWDLIEDPGARVDFIDLEQGWFLDHEDLKSPDVIYGDNLDGVGDYKGNHGTAVLGEVIAEDNYVGVVGIAPSVSPVRVVSHYDRDSDTNGNVADAILAAIRVMDWGDVLLLEVQRNYMPTEVDDTDFDAIRLAVARGIIVVEAAGNGDSDLDNYTDSVGDRILNRNDDAFRESGAIMVGSSVSRVPHDRYVGCGWTCGSNYGSRIDCYGWGENIVTCGYGDMCDRHAGTRDRTTYTNTFGGTSGASPMVAGAAIILQDLKEVGTGTRFSPDEMRQLLSNPATGTPQGGGVAGNIGVMPDLRAIITDADLIPPIDWREILEKELAAILASAKEIKRLLETPKGFHVPAEIHLYESLLYEFLFAVGITEAIVDITPERALIRHNLPENMDKEDVARYVMQAAATTGVKSSRVVIQTYENFAPLEEMMVSMNDVLAFMNTEITYEELQKKIGIEWPK